MRRKNQIERSKTNIYTRNTTSRRFFASTRRPVCHSSRREFIVYETETINVFNYQLHQPRVCHPWQVSINIRFAIYSSAERHLSSVCNLWV